MTATQCSIYNIHDNIMSRGLGAIAEVFLDEEEHGFRKGSSRSDIIFIPWQIIQKTREFNFHRFYLLHESIL
jgi:hypothetical protein